MAKQDPRKSTSRLNARRDRSRSSCSRIRDLSVRQRRTSAVRELKKIDRRLGNGMIVSAPDTCSQPTCVQRRERLTPVSLRPLHTRWRPSLKPRRSQSRADETRSALRTHRDPRHSSSEATERGVDSRSASRVARLRPLAANPQRLSAPASACRESSHPRRAIRSKCSTDRALASTSRAVRLV